jgi:hypothetical protein
MMLQKLTGRFENSCLLECRQKKVFSEPEDIYDDLKNLIERHCDF